MAPVTTSEHSAHQLARELLAPSWSRVRRIPLIRREIREFLSPRALEILFEAANGAELIVEGAPDSRSTAADQGYATVMVTVDLANPGLAAILREPPDVATANRVAELMRGSGALREHLCALARPRLAEIFGADADSLGIELSPAVRVAGTTILIDGDAVVWLGSARSRNRSNKVVGQ